MLSLSVQKSDSKKVIPRSVVLTFSRKHADSLQPQSCCPFEGTHSVMLSLSMQIKLQNVDVPFSWRDRFARLWHERGFCGMQRCTKTGDCAWRRIIMRHSSDNVLVRLQDTKSESGLKYHRTERSSTFVRRSLRLPEHADLSKVSAKYVDGVLQVEVR